MASKFVDVRFSHGLRAACPIYVVFFATIAFTIYFPSVVLWLPKQVLPASVGCFRSPSGVGYLSAVRVMFGIADQQAWHGRDHRDWREVSDQIGGNFG